MCTHGHNTEKWEREMVKSDGGGHSDDTVGIIDDCSKHQHEVYYSPAHVPYLQSPSEYHCQPTFLYSSVDT